MAEYILSIDIGTQGCKAAVFDREMKRKGTYFVPLALVSPQPGMVWQDPRGMYQACLEAARGAAENSKVPPAEIAAIGIDGQMAGIMGTDEEGEAVTPYDSWLDTRCSTYAEDMRRRYGKRITEITGAPVSFTHGPKILWLKHEQPQLYQKVYKFVVPSAYVAGRITGLRGDEQYFDYTHIQYSGFGDNLKKTWSEELLEVFQADEGKMARIISPFDVVGRTGREFAAATGLPSGIPVAAGCGDTAASVYGTGRMEKGMLLDCAGTASVLCGAVDSYKPDTEYDTITLMRSPDEDIWLPMAYINGGGLGLRWLRDELSGSPHATYEELEREAGKAEAGSGGIFFIPHFSGRVLPCHPKLSGCFAGLRWNHTRGAMYRSIMEGIAYEYRHYMRVLHELYPEGRFDRVYTMGGGAGSHLFNQIKADVLGVKVMPCKEVDTALEGSAMIAARAVGISTEQHKETADEEKGYIYPREENNKVYEKLAQDYLRLLEKIEEFCEGK
ncbi:xylulokinase [Murimonas intestini]|uniref:Xylulokinase n=1 Tax=Murimonas intestini TaxID=1337051 RepID=A0AB73SZQ6_9FIRM|nr:FGGY family carbohydrate kinase [Murimonas intestini]MCR1842806.1 FGGY family carbohydrate kinase [Murimonas intestini]MCR1867855.1 FGGY family carbohydrate kinase [Murimonas intestini]MCR1885206.1 FGGY family carbohydrate kinase [Murimonas intestini]